MKTIRLIFTFIAFALFTYSLNAQTASVTEGCIPLRVNFTAPAGSSSFFWEFGDTKTSTLQNPENIYTSAGTFTVNFRESSGGPVVGS
ncbi:MAG: PKD domain-containing protein, partial [Bacteroidota bacterium]